MALSQLLRSQQAPLRELLLQNNRIGADGAEALAAALADNAALEVLHLNGNPIGDRGAAALAAALPRCRGLRALYLADAAIGASGAAALAAALPGVTAPLVALELRGNPVSGQALALLDELVQARGAYAPAPDTGIFALGTSAVDAFGGGW